MSTGKRRKLNTEESPQPMSAFALRKKLLAQHTPVSSPPVDEAQVPESPDEISIDAKKVVTGPQKKARKTRTTRPISVERNDTPPEPSKLQHGGDSVELSGPHMSRVGEASRSSSPFSLEEGQEDHDTRAPAQPINFSTFRPSKTNARKKSNGVSQLKLEDGERLVILGSYGVRVESGEVMIYGATLRPSKDISWVHAPQSHALPVIRCTIDATLELHPHPHAHGLKELGKLSPLFRKLWWDNPSPPLQDNASRSGETFRILYTSEDGPKRTTLQDLKSPPDWNRKIATLVASKDVGSSSIMITGPKSSGKSTFGKILANRLITSVSTNVKRQGYRGVVILDLDPGQPEYCVAGQIALILVTKPVLSPSFCRPVDVPGIRTVRSHALASLSPASDPALYIEMAMDLATHYRNALGSYPLIINTPGWIQGTGLDLLVSLTGELHPSEVIYMSQTGPAEAIEALEGACNATRFSTLPSQPSQSNLRTAVHLRSMQTMAYFHAESLTHQNGGDYIDWFQRPLTAMAPWQVRFKDNGRGIFGVLCYDFQTQPDFVADSINGSLLAAVEVESTKAFRAIGNGLSWGNSACDEASPGSPMELDVGEAGQAKSPPLSLIQEMITTLTPEGIPFIDTSHGLTLDPRYSRSLGLVLVRGIDVENGDLHLLGPITTSQVEDVRARGGQIVLVSGKFDPPSWAYTEDLYLQSEGGEGDGDEGADLIGQTENTGDGAEDMKRDIGDLSYSSARSVPWIEVLLGNQNRGAGSKVWRVRRDLGRLGNPAD
ncbi:hypothetical protein HD806DRAFT_297045 [Xylariaceae sp. AK1471]|nr:hypothetical protein HD806DRAFT_297045 [Xylariaceae sp. AK1471]